MDSYKIKLIILKENNIIKTLEEIIGQKAVYLNDWNTFDDMVNDFQDYCDRDKGNEEYSGVNVVLASYSYECYSGEAFVLFEENGKLYEINASHCSCYGLEGQWSPEEVDLKELEHRLLNGSFGEDSYSENNFKQTLCNLLGVEYKKNMIGGW